MTAIFDQLIFDPQIFDTFTLPPDPPIDWAPPLVLAASPIIGQALRFLRLATIAMTDPGSDLLPALTDAFAQSADDLLASADWSFAGVLAILPSVNLPVPDDSLPASAMLPGDLIVLRQLWPRGARWRIDGTTLHHDAPGPVTIRYTARVTRQEALPATFQTALALRIALRLAGRWAGSGAHPEDLELKAGDMVRQAMRDDARQASEARWANQAQGLIIDRHEDWATEVTA